ncbi:MAG: long-chain fatty acid--CoA ligase [Gemmatimonadetes bacterium]|nr:long-chain fatty acid--CoA ligase [Gemmatimonadota bacterium]
MNQPHNLVELFFDAVERFSTKRAALRYKANGVWRDITHQELSRRVHHAALGLLQLGVQPGERVGILSPNRPEWAMADYASLLAGCVDVPIYPTLPPKHISYILRDAGVIALFVSDPEQYAKVAQIRSEVPALRYVIPFDDVPGAEDVFPFQRLLQIGAAAEPRYPTLIADARNADPEAVVTLIYTSGTTGDPKGVMLTHRNFCTNVCSALEMFSVGPDDSCLSLLPLSHSFERMGGHYTMFHAGTTINYAESMDTISADLLAVKPTVTLAVPRLFEKIYARVLDAAVSGGAVKRRLFFWSRRTGERWADLVLARQPVPAGLRFATRVADRLVFRKLRARTGGRIKFFVSGGAPLAPEIAKFFFAARLPILEGYGLTETTPVVSINTLEAPRIGTVGRPIPGVEVHIAEDGEILVRGPNVMAGYYNKPEATAEMVDADGWLHTGDVGEFDADGYLRITDRKKDLIKTAGGKYVAPQPIENLVKTSKYVLNALVLGERRKFPIIVVVPNPDAVQAFARERGLVYRDLASALKQPDVVAKLEREVMLKLRDLASYEMPKKILFLEKDFSIEAGELTPKLSVKRRVVEEHYRDRIDQLYEQAEHVQPEAAKAES